MTRDNDRNLDRLIAAHLEREGSSVNVAEIWARLQIRLNESAAERLPAPVLLRQGKERGIRWGLALAASLLLFIVGSLQWSPSSARAESLVRAAAAQQRREIDRCYEIRTELATPFHQRFPLLASGGYERIHVRGSRFWVEARKHEPRFILARPGVRWGRDELGRYWLTLGPRLGLLFEPDEVPEAFQFFIAIRGADLEGILDGLVRECQLTVHTSERPEFARIDAFAHRHRGRMGTIASAELLVRRDSREIQELCLHRQFHGEPLATVRLKRLQDQTQPDANYRIETHLMKNAVLLDKTRAQERKEAFRNLMRELRHAATQEFQQ